MWTNENFVGGHPALDFLNTVGDTGKLRQENLLKSPGDLVAWIAASGITSDGLKDVLPTQRDLEALLEFRETAFEVLSAQARNHTVPTRQLQALEVFTKKTFNRAAFDIAEAPSPWKAREDGPSYVLDSFVLMVEGFLRSPLVGKLRQCERCSWFFLNTGRGRGRRWCSMATCGNRHKVAAHRQRQQRRS